MDREQIIRMAREAGFSERDAMGRTAFLGNSYDIERFAALVAAAEREKLAAWMMRQGYATGHGDSIEKLLEELEWQIAERITAEREACAKVADNQAQDEPYGHAKFRCVNIAAAIRARGNT